MAYTNAQKAKYYAKKAMSYAKKAQYKNGYSKKKRQVYKSW